MHYAFYGPEGSGKGTQAKLLSDKLGLPLITAGDLVRKEAAENKSTLSEMCRKVLSEGKYLPDNQINLLLEKRLKSENTNKGFILDGFPRTVEQAKFLDKVLQKAGISLDKFIYLRLSDEESVVRLVKRKRTLFGGSKILHDTPERVKQRLNVYRKKEKDVLQYYRKKKIILQIDASKKVEKVFADVVSGLAASNNNLSILIRHKGP